VVEEGSAQCGFLVEVAPVVKTFHSTGEKVYGKQVSHSIHIMKTIRRIKSRQQHTRDNKPPPPSNWYLFLEKKEDFGAGVFSVFGSVTTGDPCFGAWAGAGVGVGADSELCFESPSMFVLAVDDSHVCESEPTDDIFASERLIVWLQSTSCEGQDPLPIAGTVERLSDQLGTGLFTHTSAQH
jgi:hypothetical protein